MRRGGRQQETRPGESELARATTEKILAQTLPSEPGHQSIFARNRDEGEFCNARRSSISRSGVHRDMGGHHGPTPPTPPDLRVRIQRFVKHSAVNSAPEFPSPLAGDCSTLRPDAAGFTSFACPLDPLSGEICLQRSSLEPWSGSPTPQPTPPA